MDGVGGGDCAGYFSYGSRGTRGWAVLQVVGDLPPNVVQGGVAETVRLQAPAEGGSESGRRTRRLTWAGPARDSWRYLVNTVEAGSDASRRPHNNFSHGVVVRQAQAGVGVSPARFWASPQWAIPYGPTQVAQVDLEELAPLQPTPEGRSLGMLAKRPGLLPQLATLVSRFEVALRTGRAVTIAARAAEEGALYLDAAFSLLPSELLWEATFEIRSTAIPDDAADRCPLIRIGVPTSESPMAGALRLGNLAPETAELVPCLECGFPEETWASLVLAALADVETAAQNSGDRDQAVADALSLAAAVAAVGPAQVEQPLADRVFAVLSNSPGPWADAGAELRAHEATLPRTRHQPLRGYWDTVKCGPARESELLAPEHFQSYLTQPVGKISGVAVQSVLDALAFSPPMPACARLADSLLRWQRRQAEALPGRLTWPDDWYRVLTLHYQLGLADAAAEGKIRAFAITALARDADNGGLCVAIAEGPLLGGAIATFMHSLIVWTVEGGRPVSQLTRITAPVWENLLHQLSDDVAWAEPLLNRVLFDRFLRLVSHPGRSLPGSPEAVMLAKLPSGQMFAAALLQRACSVPGGQTLRAWLQGGSGGTGGTARDQRDRVRPGGWERPVAAPAGIPRPANDWVGQGKRHAATTWIPERGK